MHKGSCLCGAVSFEVTGALPPPDACHCSQCRKQSGHFWASTDVSRADLTIHGADKLTWYRSSEKVQRGFCATCGSSLFWDPFKKDTIAVAMAYDPPSYVVNYAQTRKLPFKVAIDNTGAVAKAWGDVQLTPTT